MTVCTIGYVNTYLYTSLELSNTIGRRIHYATGNQD